MTGAGLTPVQVVAGAAALLTIAGVVMVLAGLRGWGPPAVLSGVTRPARMPGRWLVASGAGIVVWLATGWPVLGAAVAAAVLGLPAVIGSDARARAQIERVEAVEEWSRRVADILAIGVGLEQAIQSAARTAPEAIAPEATTLAARLSARMPTETALRRFADDVADPTADLVVAALVLAARRRGPGVSAALTALAGAVGEEVAARRRIEADRAKPRATARAVTLLTVALVGVGLLNRGYTDPYGTLIGQIVLAGTLGFFGAALWWMHSMTRADAAPRILGPGPGARAGIGPGPGPGPDAGRA